MTRLGIEQQPPSPLTGIALMMCVHYNYATI